MSNSYYPRPPGVTGDCNKYLRGDPVVPMRDARPDPLGSFVAPEVLRAGAVSAAACAIGMANTAELAAEPETMVDEGIYTHCGDGITTWTGYDWVEF